MNLFDKEFYPTPPETVQKMVEPYAKQLQKATILEPSAGSGAILDYICNHGVDCILELASGRKMENTLRAEKTRVYAIEHNPELQMIIQQKGYRLIASDFLAFRPEHRFDLILMNPPFSSGVKHLLHAWEILPGGDIACLLNAESVRNVCTTERERLQAIISQYGSTEFIGKAFKDADNATDVEVVIVRLHKEPKDDPFKIDIQGFAKDNAPDFAEMASSEDAVAVNSQLDAYIRCWELTKAAAAELIRACAQFRFFANSFLETAKKDTGRGENTVEGVLKDLSEVRFTSDSMSTVYNKFIDTTKARAWNVIFDQIGLGKYMTKGLQRKLDEFRTAQGAMEISKENINTLFRFIMTNIGTIMDQSIVEVYDLFTRYFDGNTDCNEGWKTNKRFKCNRKIILPGIASAGYMVERYGYDPYFRCSYGGASDLEDIDKAMCWLTGTDYNKLITGECRGNDFRPKSGPNHSLVTALSTIRVGDQGWYDSAFFRLKAFKKGTVHLEFKDEDLWNRFNIAVNQGKNELGMAE